MFSVWHSVCSAINAPPEWLIVLSVCALLQIITTVWGYPWFLSRQALRYAPPKLDSATVASIPKICVLVAAHNEAQYIQRRIQNLHNQSYPADAMRVVVICDGCTDNTEELARLEGVEVIILPEHHGKSYTLQAATDHLYDSEVVVLTDACPLFAPDAIHNLITALMQPGVAAVSGVLQLSSPSLQTSPVGKYWHAETALRTYQAVLNGTTGCTGPICACWRRYWRGMPSGIVLDDVWLALDVAAQGGRVTVCPTAVAYDDREYSPRQEWQRKVRTSAGNWQLIFTPGFWPMLLRSGKFWHWFLHKWGRLMVPFSMLILGLTVIVFSWPLAVALMFALLLAIRFGKARYSQMLPYVMAPIAGFAMLLAGRVDGRWTSSRSDATL